MSIRVTICGQVKVDGLQEFTEFLEENLPVVRGFSGNRRVSVLFSEDSREILLDEDWVSVEHHHEYLSYIEGTGVLASLVTFLESPPTIKYFMPSPL